MTSRPAIAALLFLGALPAVAQNVIGEPQADPVLEAIQKFKEHDNETPNEVSVVLDPVGTPPAPVKSEPKPVEQPAPAAAVLVTGKPPEGVDLSKPPAAAPQETTATVEDEESAKPENGLAVRVEKLRTGKGNIDPSQIKLLAPFPAKPLASAPSGWHLDASDSAPPFTREVEIAPGSKITLTIRPHVLVPDADGSTVFTISEPGYDKSLGYQQTATVGAILSNSIREIDENSKQLGAAIDGLQQLLISLPKPEPQQTDIKPAALRKK